MNGTNQYNDCQDHTVETEKEWALPDNQLFQWISKWQSAREEQLLSMSIQSRF